MNPEAFSQPGLQRSHIASEAPNTHLSPLWQRGTGGDFPALVAATTAAKSPLLPLLQRGRRIHWALPAIPAKLLLSRSPRPFRLLPALLLTLAAACSHLPGSEPAPAADYWLKSLPAASRSPAPGRAESLLLYYDYIRGLSAGELVRENEQMKQLAGNDKSDFTRMRHALLLAHQPPGSRDHARAQQLLEPLRDAKTTEPALRAFAALLVSDLSERRRLEESLQSATQRHKDEQARAADLQQKLDALKAIEKSIAERRPTPARPAPTGKPAAPRK